MEIVATGSEHLDAERRRELRTLWDRAFGGRFTDDDAEHAYGGVHVVTTEGGEIIAHASVVPRRVRFGERAWLTVGYVEAVATRPDRQGEGVGRRAMVRLQEEMINRWPVALLSTGRSTRFYELLGWERWRGLSFTRTATGVVADDEHGGLMILHLDRSVVVDLSGDVTCEDRSGDAW